MWLKPLMCKNDFLTLVCVNNGSLNYSGLRVLDIFSLGASSKHSLLFFIVTFFTTAPSSGVVLPLFLYIIIYICFIGGAAVSIGHWEAVHF